MTNLLTKAQILWEKRVASHCWISNIVASILFIFLEILSIERDWVLMPNTQGEYKTVFLSRVLHIGIALTALFVLLLFRKKLSILTLQTLFIIQTLPALITIWYAQTLSADILIHWSPALLGFKLAFLLLPCFDLGKVRINFILMLLFFTDALILWFHLDLGSRQMNLLSDEPVRTLSFAIGGFIILYLQKIYQKTTRKLIFTQVQGAANEYLAKVFLSIRDKINSPLQSLEIGLALLKRGGGDPTITTNMQNSLNKIKDIHNGFQQFESMIDWNSNIHTIEELKSILEKLSPQGESIPGNS